MEAAIINLQLLAAVAVVVSRNQRKRRRMWVRDIYGQREEKGFYNNLFMEMRLGDQEMFFNYTRLNVQQFDELLSILGPHLRRTSNRKAIVPGCRLAMTLRFLASGDSMASISFSYRVSKAAVCKIVNETCGIIWDVLQPRVLKEPTEERWREIAEKFYQKWNFPNCVGSIDGKHITIKAPNNSGSTYFNYKRTFSIVLLAVCDADFCFTVVDIGAMGSQSDGGILRQSEFGFRLKNNLLDLPEDAPLPQYDDPKKMPFCFIADEAFPLQEHLLHCYSGRNLADELKIFNYRIGRARISIEFTFGILASRWRIFGKDIHGSPENVDKYVKATVCLHNYIMTVEKNIDQRERQYFSEASSLEDMPTRENAGNLRPLREIRRLGSRNAGRNALEIRDSFKKYFMEEGSVNWQWQYVSRTQ